MAGIQARLLKVDLVPLTEPILDIRSGPFDLAPLMGPHAALGQLCIVMTVALVGGLVMPLFFAVLRAIFRYARLAAIAYVLFFSLPVLVRGDTHGAVTVALWTSLQLFVFLRFGVLSVVVGWFSWRVLGWPVALDFSAPHIEIGLVAYLLVAGLALYACFISVAGKFKAQQLKFSA